MPWNAIAYVSSGVTLVAFIFAVSAWVYRSKILQVERTILLAPKNKRAILVERALEFFNVETSTLTREQKYNLALRQVHERARRFLITASVVVILSCLTAAVSVFAILRAPMSKEQKAETSPTSTAVSSQTPSLVDPTQTPEYRVRVTDEGTHAIPGAWVTVKDNYRFTNNYTDSNGIFSTRLSSSTDIVNISVEANGYSAFSANNISVPDSRIQEVHLKNQNKAEPLNVKTEDVRTAFEDPFSDVERDDKVQKIRRKLRDLSINLDSASNPRRASARKTIEETLYLLGTAYNYEPTDEELFKMLVERIKEVNKRTDGLADIIRAFKI